MINTEDVTEMALAFEEAVEQPHFERTSFRVRKKVFATMDLEKRIVVLKLTPVDQSVFCDLGNKAVYPVSGGWGTKGYTEVDLRQVDRDLFKDALKVSYRNTAPKKLAQKYADGNE